MSQENIIAKVTEVGQDRSEFKKLLLKYGFDELTQTLILNRLDAIIVTLDSLVGKE